MYRCEFFNPEKECFNDFWPAIYSGQVATSNPNGVPDSIRIGFRKLNMCWRFGITTNCGSTDGGYVDNVSLAIIDAPTPTVSVLAQWEFWHDTFPANETANLPGTAAFDTTTALIKGGLNIAPWTGGWIDTTSRRTRSW